MVLCLEVNVRLIGQHNRLQRRLLTGRSCRDRNFRSDHASMRVSTCTVSESTRQSLQLQCPRPFDTSLQHTAHSTNHLEIRAHRSGDLCEMFPRTYVDIRVHLPHVHRCIADTHSWNADVHTDVHVWPQAGAWTQEHFVFPSLTFQKHSNMVRPRPPATPPACMHACTVTCQCTAIKVENAQGNAELHDNYGQAQPPSA